jgi:hypothetical protein
MTIKVSSDKTFRTLLDWGSTSGRMALAGILGEI